jgi:hypothetical protein
MKKHATARLADPIVDHLTVQGGPTGTLPQRLPWLLRGRRLCGLRPVLHRPGTGTCEVPRGSQLTTEQQISIPRSRAARGFPKANKRQDGLVFGPVSVGSRGPTQRHDSSDHVEHIDPDQERRAERRGGGPSRRMACQMCETSDPPPSRAEITPRCAVYKEPSQRGNRFYPRWASNAAHGAQTNRIQGDQSITANRYCGKVRGNL